MTEFETKLQQVVANQNQKIAGLEQQIRSLTQQTLNVDSLAGKRVPFHYVIPIQLTQGQDQQQEGSVQTSRSGAFFAERLICTLHIEAVEDGGDASWVGMMLPISSRPVYPFIWAAGATGTQSRQPPLDFEFGWESNSSDRARQDKFIPCDVLSKFDGDGIMPVSDIFPGGTEITFKINPLRPVGNVAPWSDADGVATFVFTAVFQGYKIIQPTQM
jgi:hypothetical protein